MDTPIPSVDALGRDAGPLAASHIATTFRRVLRPPIADHDPRFLRVVTGAAHPFGNVVVLEPSAEAADVSRAVAPLVAGGQPAAVLRHGVARPGVVEALADAGFAPHGAMPAMAVDIDALAATALPAGMRCDEVGADGAADWTDAFAVGYELPREVAALFAPASLGPDCRWFAIRDGERILATSFLHLDRGVAGIYCVATRPEARGRGLGAHATAEPLRLARTLGYRVGVLQSSEAGHGVYLRLGFRDLDAVGLGVRM
jgi:GNAT superfamily N-acetyltransferase